MRIERALRLRQECRDNLRGMYSHARAFQLTSAAMNDKRSEIFAKTSKAPVWVRSYLEGVCEVYNEQLYSDALVYGAWLGGTFYSTHRNRSDYYEKLGVSARMFSESSEATKGHYWANDPSKPFFTS